jgi:hypothetical protein
MNISIRYLVVLEECNLSIFMLARLPEDGGKYAPPKRYYIFTDLHGVIQWRQAYSTVIILSHTFEVDNTKYPRKSLGTGIE